MSDFERQWQQRFQRFATRHLTEHQVSGWSRAGLERRLARFQEALDAGLLAPGARVLELGCGAGSYVRLLAKHGHPVVGLDYSLPSLARATEADPQRMGRYVAGEAYRLPFAPGAFGGVVCIGVFQALAAPEAALGEMARVLARGGRLLVETLNPWNPLTLARRARRRLRGQPMHLRYGPPGELERAMAGMGLRPLYRLGVVLPPRWVSRAGWGLDHPRVARAIAAVPGGRLLAPHAFWVVGEKA